MPEPISPVRSWRIRPDHVPAPRRRRRRPALPRDRFSQDPWSGKRPGSAHRDWRQDGPGRCRPPRPPPPNRAGRSVRPDRSVAQGELRRRRVATISHRPIALGWAPGDDHIHARGNQVLRRLGEDGGGEDLSRLSRTGQNHRVFAVPASRWSDDRARSRSQRPSGCVGRAGGSPATDRTSSRLVAMTCLWPLLPGRVSV